MCALRQLGARFRVGEVHQQGVFDIILEVGHAHFGEVGRGVRIEMLQEGDDGAVREDGRRVTAPE